jgi:hypothetical protein
MRLSNQEFRIDGTLLPVVTFPLDTKGSKEPLARLAFRQDLSTVSSKSMGSNTSIHDQAMLWHVQFPLLIPNSWAQQPSRLGVVSSSSEYPTTPPVKCRPHPHDSMHNHVLQRSCAAAYSKGAVLLPSVHSGLDVALVGCMGWVSTGVFQVLLVLMCMPVPRLQVVVRKQPERNAAQGVEQDDLFTSIVSKPRYIVWYYWSNRAWCGAEWCTRGSNVIQDRSSQYAH